MVLPGLPAILSFECLPEIGRKKALPGKGWNLNEKEMPNPSYVASPDVKQAEYH